MGGRIAPDRRGAEHRRGDGIAGAGFVIGALAAGEIFHLADDAAEIDVLAGFSAEVGQRNLRLCRRDGDQLRNKEQSDPLARVHRREPDLASRI